ncbi:MAG: hypothetical protein HQK60_00985 [Deltaproteobacteria bacterium]|nr:hypothetical protein [Deltaproteobacteria bacterium]
MIIDQFLPDYDVSASYHISVQAPIDTVYSVARSLNMRESWIVRWLFKLRRLPGSGLTLDGMLKWGFVLLADQPSQEFVFGLIGRFWTSTPQLQSVTSDAFVRFDRPGFAKAAGNMAFIPQSDGSVRVTTETRVLGLDKASRRRFRIYWLLISPFSGLVRKEWLRLIKEQAEALSGHK